MKKTVKVKRKATRMIVMTTVIIRLVQHMNAFDAFFGASNSSYLKTSNYIGNSDGNVNNSLV